MLKRRIFQALIVPALLLPAACASSAAAEKAGAPPRQQTPTPEPGDFGEACEQHSDCATGLACMLDLCVDDYGKVRAE